MNVIEIRLDPKLVSSLMDTLAPVLRALKSELASPALLPEEDEMMENFWKSDLLKSQCDEIEVLSELFGDEFVDTGRVVIETDNMDRVLRSCSAIRLKLRETVLGELSDSQLEEGDLAGVDWDEAKQLGYAAYALFASLQEIIVSQMDDEPQEFEDYLDDAEEDEEGEL